MKKIGLLLINLGTPDAPTRTAVRRYLKEFLSDPLVIDLPSISRWLLLNAFILPFRNKSSTEAYQKIWTKEGSPLLVNSLALSEALRKKLEKTHVVSLGMRYGSPNINTALNTLLNSNIDKLIVLPLYPQYAESTTRSSLLKVETLLKKRKLNLSIQIIKHFYSHRYYINAMAQCIKSHCQLEKTEKLIFSYHGLPERHVTRVCRADCNRESECVLIDQSNADCYRAHCFETSRQVAEKLQLFSEKFVVTFQSRLGRTPWIQPYTDYYLNDLAKKGVKNIVVVCPSFVSDCLETLEEIDIRLKSQWKLLGGNSLTRIPCLNTNYVWIQALHDIVREFSGEE